MLRACSCAAGSLRRVSSLCISSLPCVGGSCHPCAGSWRGGSVSPGPLYSCSQSRRERACGRHGRATVVRGIGLPPGCVGHPVIAVWKVLQSVREKG